MLLLGSATGVSAQDAAGATGSGADAAAEADTAAAPDAAADTAPDAAAAAETETVRVHVRSLRPGIEAHVRLGTHVVTHESTSHVEDDYTLLCQPTPCDANVPIGPHLFAVSGPAGTPLPVHDVDLTPGSEHTLEIDLDDRGGLRTFGALLSIFVGVPGLVILLVGLIGPAIERGPVDAVFMAIGGPLTAVGIVGIPFLAWNDTRVVTLLD